MITKTSISAIRCLIHMAHLPPGEVVSPRRMSEQLGESPTYMAKVTRLLVKAGILRSHRGVKGGVELNGSSETISLRAIVEACQGAIVGDYCRAACDAAAACAYHQAAQELQTAMVEVLSRWNLARLAAKPRPSGPLGGEVTCVIAGEPGRYGAPGLVQLV